MDNRKESFSPKRAIKTEDGAFYMATDANVWLEQQERAVEERERKRNIFYTSYWEHRAGMVFEDKRTEKEKNGMRSSNGFLAWQKLDMEYRGTSTDPNKNIFASPGLIFRG
jgi:hypothetical protein